MPPSTHLATVEELAFGDGRALPVSPIATPAPPLSPIVSLRTNSSPLYVMSTSNVIDPQQIRVFLRLVHSLQLERGSSCVFAAQTRPNGNGTSTAVSIFQKAMEDARTATDKAMWSFRRLSMEKLRVDASLLKIRALVQNHVTNPQDSNDDLTFHRIFVCFNTLISCVVHECVLKSLTLGSGDDRTVRSTIKRRHRRGLSTDINDKLIAESSEKILATGTPTGTPTPKLKNAQRKSFVPEMVERLATDGSNSRMAVNETPRLQPRLSSGITPSHLAAGQTDSESSLRSNDDEVRQLLDLLHIFVQLKESAGVERAILSSLLAFRNDSERSLPSVSMLISDLVLEVEVQRSLYHQLERLPPGQHHVLVLDLAQLSPRLMDLQQIILTDFSSLQGAQNDAETIWELITLYIDKLHSAELLILEDMECSLSSDTAVSASSAVSTAPGSADRTAGKLDNLPLVAVENALVAIANGDAFLPGGMIAKIESIPSDILKARVLDLVRGRPYKGSGSGTGQIEQEKLKSIFESSSQSASSKGQQPSQSGSTEHRKDGMHEALRKQMERISSKEWEISIYEIKFTKRLGQGASATTYLGQWTGQNVAIKVASITDFGQDGWRTEVQSLQRLHHPNIIRMMGTIYNESPQTQCLVLEYCNAGDLASALRYPTPRNFFFHVSTSIANAMTYVHQRSIIHRDLKPANVLCDGNVASGNFTVKVTDFGIAALTDGKESESSDAYTSLNLTGETGTYRWMSPEVIRHEPYSYRCDVYSFAVMMWQFITHEEPFGDVRAVEAAELTALEKKRPPMPPLVPDQVTDLIQVNWSDDPLKRWDFGRIANELQTLKESLSEEDMAYLDEPHGHPIQALKELFDGGSDEQAAPTAASSDLASAGRLRESKNSLGRRERSWKSRKSTSPPRKPSPGRRPSLLSSFFGQRRKGTFDHQSSKYRARIGEREVGAEASQSSLQDKDKK